MKYKIVFEKGVLNNFQERIDYYEKISPKIADKFHKEFFQKIDFIKTYPLQFWIRYRQIRIANLDSFPIGIHFIIEQNIVLVLKILHHKQFYK